MRLPASGREYATFPVNVPLTVPLDVSFDGGATWTVLTRPSDDTAQALLAGPTASENPPSTVVLGLGHHRAAIRLNANPEVVIREAGEIFVFDLEA